MTRRAWLPLLSLLAVLALGCSRTSMASATDPKSLTVDQVATLVAAHDGKTFIFDNNEKERWVKSHVPGAKWLDYDSVTAADLPADKGATLVFYCASEL